MSTEKCKLRVMLAKIKRYLESLIENRELPLTAERAWVETTYGQCTYNTIEKRVKRKQEQIKRIIKSKFAFAYNASDNTRSYYCVVDIEDDLKNSIEDILRPFKEGGFIIINLAERIPEIKDSKVFLISWAHVFDDSPSNS